MLLGKPFKSNCLFTALAIKFKHWNRFDLLMIPLSVQWKKYRTFAPHFFLACRDKNYQLHFWTCKFLKYPWEYYFWKGYVKAYRRKETIDAILVCGKINMKDVQAESEMLV